ncbi:DM4/DM12 family domain-containing protein [Phthorimaea operculella]|nr:DM4/DM12 family domain-containing protein [Phthorimaea operculella]
MFSGEWRILLIWWLTASNYILINQINTNSDRQKRYLIFTPSTQWGVFATISIPLNREMPVSVAWFFEANYFTIDNATWLDPLLGDFQVSGSRSIRSDDVEPKEVITRKLLYIFIETMLENHGYPGRPCLLRAICENTRSHFLHNGVLGDVLHLILTPSTSLSEEDIEDSFYEAEYLGLEGHCDYYFGGCPMSPLELITVYTENT